MATKLTDFKPLQKEVNELREQKKELINALKKALNMFGRGYEPKNDAEPTAGSRTYLECVELIKKME